MAVSNYDEMNIVGRVLGYVDRHLECAIDNHDVDLVRQHFANKSRNACGGLVIGYIEAHADCISAKTVRFLVGIEPRLICTDIAIILLNSANISALCALEELGYIATQELAETLSTISTIPL